MSRKNWHQNWTHEMCKCLLQSLLIWLDEVHLRIYKKRTTHQSPVDHLPQSVWLFHSFHLEIHARFGKIRPMWFSINKCKHTPIFHWDKCLVCENRVGKGFLATRQPHPHPVLSLCPWSAPWSSVLHPSHQGPELTCLARPQTGRPLHQGVSKQTLQGHAARSIPRPSPSSENTSVSWFSSYPCCFFQVAPGACATGASVLHQGHHKWLCSAQPSGS